MSVEAVAAAAFGVVVLGLLGVAAMAAGIVYAVLRAQAPAHADATMRADVTALKLEHDKLVESVTRWNKKKNPEGLPPVEPANGGVNPRDVKLELIRRRIRAAQGGR